jgi:hypothetical protein
VTTTTAAAAAAVAASVASLEAVTVTGTVPVTTAAVAGIVVKRGW